MARGKNFGGVVPLESMDKFSVDHKISDEIVQLRLFTIRDCKLPYLARYFHMEFKSPGTPVTMNR